MGSEEFLNGVCRLAYKWEYRRFSAPLDVESVQKSRLLEIVRKNAGTVYGRKYGFDRIRCYEDFAERVPLTVYEDWEPYIEAAAKGEKRVLTSEDIILFELTSGSSGGKKLIPYTRSLKNEFQRGIKSWLYDIYTNVDGVCSGKSYWSITPVTAGKTYTEAGIPIGFEEDADYFGTALKSVMNRLFAVSSGVKFSKDAEDFYFRTAEQLLNCGRLTLISVWNPTFLTILCGFIRGNAQRLGLRGEKKKAAEENRFEEVFPDLKIISCWADGSAADCIGGVRELFPNVYIQPKGLLATECFVSFPLVGETGSRLSVFSHFFEFRSLRDGKIYPAHRLEKGEYEVIVTTGGGFYRYQTGDIAEVLEVFPDRPPLIKFLRRKGIASDLFGEKLTEEFVRSVCAKLGISDKFCLLAPCGNSYKLYTTAINITNSILDNALRESYHYDYCRSLGQLRSAEVQTVRGNPEKNYVTRLASEGMRIGDIKPAFLSRLDGWDNVFETDAT